MQQSEKIRISQFTILVTLFTLGTSILLVPAIVSIVAKQDGWISTVLALLLAIPLIFMYNKLASSFQGKDFLAFLHSILGKWVGKIIVIGFMLYNTILLCLLIRQVAHFSVSQSFAETPKGVMIGLFLFLVIIGSKYGIETLARSGEILLPWVSILLVILLLALIPNLRMEHLFPMFEKGIKPILLGTFGHFSFPYSELYVFLFLIPYVNTPEKAGKAFYIGAIIGGMILILVTLYAILVLGGEGAARNQFPSYTMAKRISIGSVIERIEAFLAAIWFITIFIKATITFYCTTLCMAHIFNLKKKDALMFPFGFILLFLTLYITRNMAQFDEFGIKTWPLYSMTIGIMVPLLLIALAAIKNRRKRRVKNA